FLAEERGTRHADSTGSEATDGDSIDAAALECLTEHTWPGNIRELRNVIRSAFAICDDKIIRLCDLPAQLSAARDAAAAYAARLQEHTTTPPTDSPASPGRGTFPTDPLARAEREALLGAIRSSRGNLCHTAKQLGISRNSLYRKLKRHGIAVSRVDGLSVRNRSGH